MSQKRGSGTSNAVEGQETLTVESFQHYLDTEAERREAAAEQTQGIIARFFKMTVVLVGLNMVIAGANVAMIITRSGHSESTPAAQPSTPTPTPTATAPTSPTSSEAMAPAGQSPQSAEPEPSPQENATSQPVPTAKPLVPEKRIPLLGPLPSTLRPVAGPAVALVRQPIHAQVKVAASKSALAVKDDDSDDDGRPHPVERW